MNCWIFWGRWFSEVCGDWWNIFPLCDVFVSQVTIYRDRKSLCHSINDAKQVLKQFDQFFSSTVIVITVIVWLLLARIVSADLIVFLSTQFLVAAFVFGNVCKNVFESVVFLFVIHPFDVGDRLVVDGVQVGIWS